MSDRADMWSLPWHELQRRLAAALSPAGGGRFAGSTAPDCRFSVAFRCPPNPTWLGRARARAELGAPAAK